MIISMPHNAKMQGSYSRQDILHLLKELAELGYELTGDEDRLPIAFTTPLEALNIAKEQHYRRGGKQLAIAGEYYRSSTMVFAWPRVLRYIAKEITRAHKLKITPLILKLEAHITHNRLGSGTENHDGPEHETLPSLSSTGILEAAFVEMVQCRAPKELLHELLLFARLVEVCRGPQPTIQDVMHDQSEATTLLSVHARLDGADPSPDPDPQSGSDPGTSGEDTSASPSSSLPGQPMTLPPCTDLLRDVDQATEHLQDDAKRTLTRNATICTDHPSVTARRDDTLDASLGPAPAKDGPRGDGSKEVEHVQPQAKRRKLRTEDDAQNLRRELDLAQRCAQSYDHDVNFYEQTRRACIDLLRANWDRRDRSYITALEARSAAGHCRAMTLADTAQPDGATELSDTALAAQAAEAEEAMDKILNRRPGPRPAEEDIERWPYD